MFIIGNSEEQSGLSSTDDPCWWCHLESSSLPHVFLFRLDGGALPPGFFPAPVQLLCEAWKGTLCWGLSAWRLLSKELCLEARGAAGTGPIAKCLGPPMSAVLWALVLGRWRDKRDLRTLLNERAQQPHPSAPQCALCEMMALQHRHPRDLPLGAVKLPEPIAGWAHLMSLGSPSLGHVLLSNLPSQARGRTVSWGALPQQVPLGTAQRAWPPAFPVSASLCTRVKGGPFTCLWLSSWDLLFFLLEEHLGLLVLNSLNCFFLKMSLVWLRFWRFQI